MASNDQSPELLAQANLLQQPAVPQAPAFSQPTPRQPNQAELQFLQGVITNPPLGNGSNAAYQLPNNINDVAGQKGNGYASADDAARAVAVSLQAFTNTTGSEAGAWIASKQVSGQERFFVVAGVRGQGHEIDSVDLNKAIEDFKAKDVKNEYTVITNIHSHPQAAQDKNGNVGPILEGPSRNDLNYWAAANLNGFPDKNNPGQTYYAQNKGYVVSADGDVYRMDFPDLKQASPQVVNNMASGQFPQSAVLNRIGDVTPTVGDDNALRPNLNAKSPNAADIVTLPNGTQLQGSYDLLPPSQVRDTVPSIKNDPLFQQAQVALQNADQQKLGQLTPEQRENMAGTLVLEARLAGMNKIDSVAFSNDGKQMFGVQGSGESRHNTNAIDKAAAGAQSIEASSERLLNAMPNLPTPKTNPAQTSDNPMVGQDQIALGGRGGR